MIGALSWVPTSPNHMEGEPRNGAPHSPMKPAKFDGHIKGKVELAKMHQVMHEFKHDELHSGSKKGPKVKSRKQAIAIALSEARRA